MSSCEIQRGGLTTAREARSAAVFVSAEENYHECSVILEIFFSVRGRHRSVGGVMAGSGLVPTTDGMVVGITRTTVAVSEFPGGGAHGSHSVLRCAGG